MRGGLRVLFMTGYLPGTSTQRDDATPDQTEVLQKPFSSQALIEAVTRALLPSQVSS